MATNKKRGRGKKPLPEETKYNTAAFNFPTPKQPSRRRGAPKPYPLQVGPGEGTGEENLTLTTRGTLTLD